MISLGGLCVSDNYIWAILKNTNVICKIEKKDWTLKKTFVIEQEVSFEERALNEKMIIVNHYLFIFFYNSNRLYAFDLIKEEIVWSFLLPISQRVFQEAIKVVNNIIYLLPCWKMPLIKIEIEEDKPKFDSKQFSDHEYYFSRCCGTDNKNIYSVDKFSNTLYVFDIEGETIETRSIGDQDCIFRGIKVVDDTIVLIPFNNSSILFVDKDSLEIKKTVEFPKWFKYEVEKAFYEVFVYKKNIFLFPNHSNRIIKINAISAEVEGVFDSFFYEHIKNASFIRPDVIANATQRDNMVYTYDNLCNKWFVFDLANLSYQTFDFLNARELEELCPRGNSTDMSRERDYLTLEDYLLHVINL